MGRTDGRVSLKKRTRAKRYSSSLDLVPIAESIFGNAHATNSEDEGKLAANKFLQQDDTSMVIPVGGDGTLSSILNVLTQTVYHVLVCL
jgi:diacylglycerol kinase family enzyme